MLTTRVGHQQGANSLPDYSCFSLESEVQPHVPAGHECLPELVQYDSPYQDVMGILSRSPQLLEFQNKTVKLVHFGVFHF